MTTSDTRAKCSIKKTISKAGETRYYRFSMQQIRYFPMPKKEAEALLAAGQARIYEVDDKRGIVVTMYGHGHA